MPKVVGTAKVAKRRVTCNNCASIVEYVKKEIACRSYKDMSGTSEVYHFITCPGDGCGKEIEVKDWY